MMNKIKRFEEASHWLVLEDENNKYSGVTIGKEYKLHWDYKNEEYYIVDDKGFASLIFLAHNGEFINNNL